MNKDLKNIGLQIQKEFENFHRSNSLEGISLSGENLPLPKQYYSLLKDSWEIQNISSQVRENLENSFPNTFAPESGASTDEDSISSSDFIPESIEDVVFKENFPAQTGESNRHSSPSKIVAEPKGKENDGYSGTTERKVQESGDLKTQAPSVNVSIDDPAKKKSGIEFQSQESTLPDKASFGSQKKNGENNNTPTTNIATSIKGIGALSNLIKSKNDGLILLSPEESDQIKARNAGPFSSDDNPNREMHNPFPKQEIPSGHKKIETASFASPGGSEEDKIHQPDLPPNKPDLKKELDKYFNRSKQNDVPNIQRSVTQQPESKEVRRKSEPKNFPVQKANKPSDRHINNLQLGADNQTNKSDHLNKEHKQQTSDWIENNSVNKTHKNETTHQDTDEILEALAKQLYKEYKRYYGN